MNNAQRIEKIAPICNREGGYDPRRIRHAMYLSLAYCRDVGSFSSSSFVIRHTKRLSSKENERLKRRNERLMAGRD